MVNIFAPKRAFAAALAFWIAMFFVDQISMFVYWGDDASCFQHSCSVESDVISMVSYFICIVLCALWYFLHARRSAITGAFLGIVSVVLVIAGDTFVDSLNLPFILVKPSYALEAFEPGMALLTIAAFMVCGWVAHLIAPNAPEHTVPILSKPQDRA